MDTETFVRTADPGAAWHARRESLRTKHMSKQYSVPTDVVARQLVTISMVDDLNASHAREGFIDLQQVSLKDVQRALQQSILETRCKTSSFDEYSSAPTLQHSEAED